MKYILEFVKQIDEICTTLDSFKAAGGADFLLELSEVVLLLEKFPLMGQEIEGYIRRIVMTKSKYNVYYKVNQATNEMRVLSIVYGPRVG